MLERCVSMWFVIMLLFFHIFLYVIWRSEIINKIFFHQKNNHELIRLFTWNRWDLHQFIFLLFFFVRTIGWEGKRINFIFINEKWHADHEKWVTSKKGRFPRTYWQFIADFSRRIYCWYSIHQSYKTKLWLKVQKFREISGRSKTPPGIDGFQHMSIIMQKQEANVNIHPIWYFSIHNSSQKGEVGKNNFHFF